MARPRLTLCLSFTIMALRLFATSETVVDLRRVNRAKRLRCDEVRTGRPPWRGRTSVVSDPGEAPSSPSDALKVPERVMPPRPVSARFKGREHAFERLVSKFMTRCGGESENHIVLWRLQGGPPKRRVGRPQREHATELETHFFAGQRRTRCYGEGIEA